jgi:hypothetical protein
VPSLVADSLFGQRLDLFSVAVRELPQDVGLLVGLLAAARDFAESSGSGQDAARSEPDRLEELASP